MEEKAFIPNYVIKNVELVCEYKILDRVNNKTTTRKILPFKILRGKIKKYYS
jgi:hypothetical protein